MWQTLRILGYILLAIAFLFVFAIIGELFVLLGLFSLPFLARRTRRTGLVITAALISIAGLYFHFQGYKIYGAPQVARTPPLADTRQLTSLEPPNILHFANGETATLPDIYIPSAVRFDHATDGHAYFRTEDLRLINFLHRLGYGRGDTNLDVQVDPQARRAFLQQRFNYWCGNTFLPTFLPRSLPSHQTIDLGLSLVHSGLALPAATPGADAAYREALLDACSDRLNLGYYFTNSGITRHDPIATSLGRSLATSDSRYFVTGAALLIAAQMQDSYPALRREIQRRKAINRDDYDEVAQIRSADFDTLLAWMDHDTARHLYSSHQVNSDDLSWSTAAVVLASHGDLSGFDAAIARLSDHSHTGERQRSLDQGLRSFFRFPKPAPNFVEWYQAIRPHLKTGRGPTGSISFWLDGGTAFDSGYFASMSNPVTATR